MGRVGKKNIFEPVNTSDNRGKKPTSAKKSLQGRHVAENTCLSKCRGMYSSILQHMPRWNAKTFFGVSVIAAAAYYALRSYWQWNAGSIDSDAELLARHMYPGVQLASDGSAGCKMKVDGLSLFTQDVSGVKRPQQCEKDVTFVRDVIIENGRDDILNLYKTNHYSGMNLTVSDAEYQVGYPGWRMGNYRAVVEAYMETLGDRLAFLITPTSRIIEAIKAGHKGLTLGLSAILEPGQFRHTCNFVYRYEGLGRATGRRAFLEAKKEAHNLTDEVIEAGASQLKSPCEMSPLQAKAYSYLGVVAPSPAEIEPALTSLIDDLKGKMREGVDCVTLAADWHQRFGRIQPFFLNNGKLSRLMMNLFLGHCDIKPVIIPNDDVYMEAVYGDYEQPGAFKGYLDVLIQWNEAARSKLMGR